MNNIKFVLLFVVLLSLSCSVNMTEDELKDWVKSDENGWVRERIVNDTKMVIQLLPTIGIKDSTINQMADFKITFVGTQVKNDIRSILLAKYGKEDVMKYFSFDFEKHICLNVNDKKINPSIYYFEQGTDIANNYCFMVSFDYEIDSDFVLEIDPKLLDLGVQKIKFYSKDILNKPRLKS